MTAHIKRPPQTLTGPPRAAAWLLLTFGCLLLPIGTAFLSLGGYALLSTLFGNTDQLAFPWWPFFPGIAMFWGGGAIGQFAANLLQLD